MNHARGCSAICILFQQGPPEASLDAVKSRLTPIMHAQCERQKINKNQGRFMKGIDEVDEEKCMSKGREAGKGSEEKALCVICVRLSMHDTCSELRVVTYMLER